MLSLGLTLFIRRFPTRRESVAVAMKALWTHLACWNEARWASTLLYLVQPCTTSERDDRLRDRFFCKRLREYK
jgi:hypothetical protein